MTKDDYSALCNLLEEFRIEAIDVDSQLAYYDRSRKQAEIILKGFTEAESEDFKVFSPRRMEVLHKDEIEKAKNDIKNCDGVIGELGKKRERLTQHISFLENIIKHQENEVDFEMEEEERREKSREWKTSSIKKLEDILQKIEQGEKEMEKNHSVQAKQEFMIAARYLGDFITDLKSTNII